LKIKSIFPPSKLIWYVFQALLLSDWTHDSQAEKRIIANFVIH
jgi:hypothetical protein